MLSPDEIVQCGSAGAFLFCAVTSIRRASIDAVQIAAKRDSFSRRFCDITTDFSHLWRGLEQTAFK
jgi:hypothetical protein